MTEEESGLKIEYGMKVTHVEFLDRQILDEQKITEIRESLEPVVDRNDTGQMILNFVNVQFMTSAMLGLLVRINKKVREHGGTLGLCNVDPKIREIFEITQLDKVFDIS